MKKVDDYIESLPDEKRVIAELIREMLFENVPTIEERLSYKLPFYHYFGMFVFLNNTKVGIDVVFCRGKDLVDEFPQLTVNKRAIMAGICISSKEDIRRYHLKEIILTAAAWNREAKEMGVPNIKTVKKKRN
jgi:hypothetical protein